MTRKKADNDTGTIYQRKDGTWRGRIVINGHTYEKESKAKTTVTSWLRAKRGQATRAATPGQRMTVRAWMTKYFAEVAPERCNSDTLFTYRSLYENWADKVIGQKLIDNVTADDLRKIRKNMKDAGRAPSSIRQITDAVLGRAFKIAVREGAASGNPVDLVDGVTVTAKRPNALEEDEAARFVAAVNALPRNRARWLLGVILGVRQGECLGLTWDHVDLKTGRTELPDQLKRQRATHGCGDGVNAPVVQHNGVVKVKKVYPCGQRQPSKCPTAAVPGGLIRRKVKTKKSDRDIMLGPTMLTILRAHRAEQLREQLALGAVRDWEPEPGVKVQLVFTQPNGRPLDPRRDNADFKALCAAAGIPMTTRLHDLRHTAITAMYELGADDKEVSDMAGHSQVSFTRTQYEHVRARRRTRVAELAESRLSS